MQYLNARSITIHPNWDQISVVNDFAVIELERPFKQSADVSIICLDRSGESVISDKDAIISGKILL